MARLEYRKSHSFQDSWTPRLPSSEHLSGEFRRPSLQSRQNSWSHSVTLGSATPHSSSEFRRNTRSSAGSAALWATHSPSPSPTPYDILVSEREATASENEASHIRFQKAHVHESVASFPSCENLEDRSITTRIQHVSNQSLKPLILASRTRSRPSSSSYSSNPSSSSRPSPETSPSIGIESLPSHPETEKMLHQSDRDGYADSNNAISSDVIIKADNLPLPEQIHRRKKPARPSTAPNSPEASRISSQKFLAPQVPVPELRRQASVPDQVPTLKSQGLLTAPSETWTNPQDADGDFVRRTYAHFALAGVPGDGFSEGKEYTREKSGLPAWEEARLAASLPSTPPRTRLSTFASLPKAASPASAAGSPLAAVPAAIAPHQNGDAQVRTNGFGTPGALSVNSEEHLGSATLDGVEARSPSLTASSKFGHGLAEAVAAATVDGQWQEAEKEAEKRQEALLGSIDRYGFFSEGLSLPSHNRTVLLPNAVFDAALPKRAGKSRIRPSDPAPGELSRQTSRTMQDDKVSKQQLEVKATKEARAAADAKHRAREQGRIAKWSKMLQVTERDQGMNAVSHDFTRKLDKQVRGRIYKGIPDIWRAAAWWVLITRKAQSSTKGKTAAEAKAIRLEHTRRFSSLLAVASPHDVQIDLDVPRTISGHVMFHTRYGRGQRSLFQVLHAISLLCPDCAYCQGMGPIAATLLCYASAEEAYAAMVMLHDNYGLHATFSPGFPGLVENFYVQDELIKAYMPEVRAVLEEQMIVTSAFATKWYITLFSNTVPFETHLRIWDAWLLDGQDVITLVALAIVWAHRAVILSPGADFETILGGLSGYFVPEDDDGLMLWVAAMLERKDVRVRMRRAREEWKKMVDSGAASEMVL